MNHKNQYRNDFLLLTENPLVYLDSTATAQKPFRVTQTERDFYECYNANPMRGFYALSLEVMDWLEKARDGARRFINVSSADEIVLTRNTMESLSLAAHSYGLSYLKVGDEILVSVMEHHSNLLPRQMAARQTGASLRFSEYEEDGRITQERLDQAFSRHTRLVAIAHVSNVLGCVNPVKEIVSIARKHGAVVALDAAQSAPRMSIDVRALNADFLVFSSHKLMGPMSIGVLYGRRALLEETPSFLTGGEMTDSVTGANVVFVPVPHKFEAGMANAAGAWGLTAAMDYLKTIGFDEVHRQESALTIAALEGLRQISHVHVSGSKKPEEYCGILTFTIDGVHPHDVSVILDSDGIAVRAGHHYAQSLFEYLKVSSTTRASFCLCNTWEGIAAFLRSVSGIRRKIGYGK